MRTTVADIIREARGAGIDPVEHARDLGDGYGWDDDMTEHAAAAVCRAVYGTSGDDEHRCYVCGEPLDPEHGDLFIADDGETYCADHFPDRDDDDCRDAGQHGGPEAFYGARTVCRTHAIARRIY